MRGPANVSYPLKKPPEKEKCSFAYQKETSNKGGNHGLTVFLPAFHPKCPLGSAHRTCIIVAWGEHPLSY